MRLTVFITLLLVTALAGCRVHTRSAYPRRAYAAPHAYAPPYAYGPEERYAVPPAPPPRPAARVAPAESDVEGSDGTFGWQRTCNADVAIHELSARMARKGCQIESYGYDETMATCDGAQLLLRRDATHVYRLCPAETDHAECKEAWARVLAR
jgi:hypothetical protein